MRIVILGAGTGGTLTANRLDRLYGDRAEIVAIDRDRHVYQPALLLVPSAWHPNDPGIRRARRGLRRTIGEFYALAAGGQIIFT